ncbi:DUF1801 domain-containing protein [Psychrosphaera sp. 1_MG-2023]|uniref:DUF1801 domain-containing protein n=1 Tax=Psychrosphaera sp. 1_MG-2023 TaxID=3062643 RepID=UPI0026E28ACB|nr:DUF1801 domain-containing protein [Psychrosphaera sp. 1_MG-2023]MDO6718950.1 DUF1801 domain-containing protein [Psychrosphaera sp. 1_MG-2023]
MELSVQKKFETYPDDIAAALLRIRTLIYQVAEQDGIDKLEETLKWGEPSYISPIGSTIRFDWKAKHPDEYCLYFNCKTTLIETFKEIYGETFVYQGNRALVFKISQIDIDAINDNPALAHCLSMALRYKKIKHLKLLGA